MVRRRHDPARPPAQAQQQYPVLDYFHVPDDDRALPVASATFLDVLTACLAVLDEEHHPGLTRGPRVTYAFHAAVRYLAERAEKIDLTFVHYVT